MGASPLFILALLLLSFAPNIEGQSCPPTFALLDNQTNLATLGASPRNSIPNAAACQDACVQDSSCVSYQIDTSLGASALCWIQNDINKVTSINSWYLRQGIAEYVKNVTCLSTTVPTTSPGCIPIFTLLNGQNNVATIGANSISSISDGPSCKDRCTQDPSCVSYQIDTQSSVFCWIQTDALKLNDNNFWQYRTQISEYVKNTTYCLGTSTSTGCPPSFRLLNNQTNVATLGATELKSILNEAGCTDACLRNPSCASYQLDYSVGRSSLCWIQTDAQKVNDIHSWYLRPQVSEYVKDVTSCLSTTVTTAAISTAAPCAYVFVLQPGNVVSFGATAFPALTTNDTCRQACLNDNACLSYQTDTNPGSTYCWLKYTLNANSDRYLRPGVFEYFKVCPSSSTTVTTATTTLTTVTATTAPGCLPTFNDPVPATVSGGAVRASNVIDAAVCRDGCLKSPSCVSYQIDTSLIPLSCWTQSDPLALAPGNLFIRPGVIEYVKNTTYCLYSTSASTTNTPCTIVFVPQPPDRATIYAIPNATFTSNDSCRQACMVDSKCLSYQINTNISQILCWIQFNSDAIKGPLYSRPGVIEFFKTCAESTSAPSTTVSITVSGCIANYRALPANEASIGAVSLNRVVTRQECEAACTADATCVSYQIDSSSSPPSCWLQKSNSSLQKQFSRPNVTEYIKFCASATASTPCTLTFVPFAPDRSSIGAELELYISADLCRDNCLNQPTCVSYQIDSANVCWFQRDGSKLNQLYFQPGVTEYKKVCASSTVTSTTITTVSASTLKCATFYIAQNPNGATFGASSAPNLITEQSCGEACTRDSTCVSYQLNTNPGNPLCWLQRNLNQNRYFQAGVTEFVKNVTCSQLNSTTATPQTISIITNTSTSTTTPTTPTSPTTSISSTSPTSAPACSVIYEIQNPGYSSLSATSRPTLSAVACEGNCTSDPSCRSYQLTRNSECWHQLVAGNLAQSNLYFSDTDVIEYIKICASDCKSGINFVEDIYGFVSIGADLRPSLNAVQCRDACLNDAQCKSYQIDRTSGSEVCWVQRQPSPYLPLNLYPKPVAINEYKKVCGQWNTIGTTATSTTSATTTSTTTTPTTTLTTATSTTTSTTVTTTRTTRTTPPVKKPTPSANSTTEATTTSTMMANTSAPTISTITPTTATIPTTNTPITTSTIPRTAVTTGSSTSVSTSTTTQSTPTATLGCQPVYAWILTTNSNIEGGSFSRANTLDSCQQACIVLDNCIGIDVDLNFSPIQCYLHFKQVPLKYDQGVNHYALTRSQSGCTSTATTITPQTPSPTCNSIVKLNGVNADAGDQIASNVDESTCLSLCDEDPLCVSVDYALQPRSCYVHRTASQAQANSCCIRYAKCSGTGTNSPWACQVQFSEFPSFSPDLYKSYSSLVATLDGCKSSCLSTNCTSFAYMSISSSCYLFRNEVASIRYNPSSTLFIRHICVSDVVLTSTTMTTFPTPAKGECFVDLALLMDNSGSINEDYMGSWNLQKNFTRLIVSKSIRYGYYFDHLAIVTFSDSATVIFDFNQFYTNFTELLGTIDSLPFAGAETNIPSAMRVGRELFQNGTRGARPGVIPVMILITDGDVSSPWVSDFPVQAALLDLTNIKRFVVGIGYKINMQELIRYASPGGVAWVPSFQNINEALTNLTLFINGFTCLPFSQTPGASSLINKITVTTTTTSTTTPIPTTSTTIPTTINQTPLSGADCTFGVALTQNANGPADPLLANYVYANRLNGWVQATDQCRVDMNFSQSVIEICAGVPGSTVVQLKTSGASPTPVNFDWFSTTNTDLETGCRSAVVSFSRGVAISLRLAAGNVFSLAKQTGWSSFSVTRSMFQSKYLFSGYSQETYSGYNVIRFPNPHVNPADGYFNAAQNTYQCTDTGYYYFSFSGGVPADSMTQLFLEGLNKIYAAQRMSKLNGLTTISRSILIPCNQAVNLAISFGKLDPGFDSNLISFVAFPITNRLGNPTSWAAYRSNGSGEANPLSFDDWVITQGINPINAGLVPITYTGYYYVYVSIGTVPSRRASVLLRRNDDDVFSIDRRSTSLGGPDTIGRGTVIYLLANDVLKVVVQSGSAIDSSPYGYYTSFFGFAL